MANNTILKKLRREGETFLSAAASADERAYLILLSLYVALYFLLKFGWARGTARMEGYIRYTLIGLVVWGSAVYLFFGIAKWKEKDIPLALLIQLQKLGVVQHGLMTLSKTMN